MIIEFHPAAAAEFDAAFFWYAERSASAAEGFDKAVSQALLEIEEAPERWALVNGRHRVRILNKKYPYHVVYWFANEIVTVIAVAHHRRKPNYWIERH